MARVRPEHRGHLLGARICALLATASVAAVLCAAPVHAQDVGLRGAVTDDQGKPLKRKRPADASQDQAADADTQNQAVDYQPASPGAVPDKPTNASASLFSEPPNADDAFANDARPLQALPPTTARDRAKARREQLAGRQQPANAPKKVPAPKRDETTTGTVRQQTVDFEGREDNGPESARQTAIEGRKPQPELNPYDPTGIRFGTFVLKPSLEQGVTATSNADSSSDGKSAILSETTLRLNAASDWDSHSATVDAYGNFRRSVSGQEVKDVTGGIDGRLQLDLAEDMRALARLGYNVRPESATSPVIIVGTAERPTLQTFNGSLGLEKDLGKLRFGISGEAVKESYGDAALSGGGTLSQKDRNSTLYNGRLRIGYEVSPALTPFGEIQFGRRIYDLRFDTAGFERSANQFAALAGVEIDMGEKFGGEISAGWVGQTFDDDRLGSISAASVAADLLWSPMRGTIVTLNGTTALEGSTSAGESGSVLYAARLGVERQMRANLTGFAAAGIGWRDYAGSTDHDLSLSAEAGLTWWLNRYTGLTGRLRHETFSSTLSNRDSTTNSVFVGVKVQR